MKNLGFCLYHHLQMKLTLDKILPVCQVKYNASGTSEMKWERIFLKHLIVSRHGTIPTDSKH